MERFHFKSLLWNFISSLHVSLDFVFLFWVKQKLYDKNAFTESSLNFIYITSEESLIFSFSIFLSIKNKRIFI